MCTCSAREDSLGLSTVDEFLDAQTLLGNDRVLRYASSWQTHTAQLATDDKQLIFYIPCSSPGEVFSEFTKLLFIFFVDVSNLAFV